MSNNISPPLQILQEIIKCNNCNKVKNHTIFWIKGAHKIHLKKGFNYPINNN